MRYLSPRTEKILVSDRKMAFVTGPRQVGKTTLALSLLKDRKGYFNWDIEEHQRLILGNPEGFWGPGTGQTRLVLDEIHKYPRWKRFLKGLADATRGDPEIVVTGSGRLDLYQRGGDSLFGRYRLAHLHPFSVGEVIRPDRQSVLKPDEALSLVVSEPAPAGADDALNRIEKFTGFPEPLFKENDEELVLWRREHRRLVVREDLRDLTRIRELGLIDALVQLLPERVGSPLSLNALREDLRVTYPTAQNWILALERLYYLFEIRPYAGRLARALSREAKVYLYEGTSIPNDGARFENLVALHLKKACDAWSDFGFGDFDLHYVRDKEKREVDFLVCRDRRPFLMVESKLAGPDISKNLVYFRERLKPAHAFQVVRDLSRGIIRRPSEGVTLCDAARFLARLP